MHSQRSTKKSALSFVRLAWHNIANAVRWYHGRYPATLLATLAFLESILLPLPPDAWLAATSIRYPERKWHLAMSCTLFSVIGGVCSWYIGHAIFEKFGAGLLEYYNAYEGFYALQRMLKAWGFWIVLLKGLTPFPYKILALACGSAGLSLPLFVVASLLSRGLRFVSVVWIFAKVKKHASLRWQKSLIWIIWIITLLVVVCAFLGLKFL